MTKIVEITNDKEKENYNKLASHPLQSWEWGEFRKSQGHKVIRIGKINGNQLTEVYQITFHKTPLVRLAPLFPCPYTVGYLPKSTLPDKEVVKKLKEIGKKEKVIFIKLEPNVEYKSKRAEEQELKNFGLIPGKELFTKYTSVIDLTKSEEELLKGLKSKTRYNIRLAQKHGVIVKEDNRDLAFNEYLKLLFETTKRQGFYAHDKNFHHLQWSILRPAGISHLLLATYQGKILAAFLLFSFNRVLYYPYGASTRENKELMAPTLLMWEAIRFGKALGCQKFDLWGDLEPNPSPNNPYFGFHKFKEGFSPKLVEFIGTYDLIINPTLYQIYTIIDKIRWTLLRLKRKLF